MQQILHGVVHGKTIELTENPGLTEGQQVQVVLKTMPKPGIPGGLERCAGALADGWTEEDDRILEMLHRERKTDTRRELTE